MERLLRAIFVTITILLLSSGVWAQKNKKDKNPPPADQTVPAMPLPPADEIDHDIGEMLGAQQLGNLEAMHKYYADSATFVSGNYGPPIVGWNNWAAGYERQKAAFQQMQIVRRNTYVYTHGDAAWATYQWEFTARLTDGKPFAARGQTTLVLTKIGNNWLIMHNHTGEDCDFAAAQQTPQAPQTPQAQPAPQTPANQPGAPANAQPKP